MKRAKVFLTGASGALGPALLAELLASPSVERVYAFIRPETNDGFLREIDVANRARVHCVRGDVRNERPGEQVADIGEVDVLIHAAADTRFRADEREQYRVNVEGTRNVLNWARRWPDLQRFVFVSTTCVAGTQTGRVRESLSLTPPEFVNSYEKSKWLSERLAHGAEVPTSIVRLSTVIGSERTGQVSRVGAVQHVLQWMYRGLIPIVPGSDRATVDFISTEYAARCIARTALSPKQVPAVIHCASGDDATPLSELLATAVEEFAAMSPAWKSRQIDTPLIVDRGTFELFRESIRATGDVLFCKVLDSVACFLPGLLYPKQYETTCLGSLMGDSLPLGDWPALLRRVIRAHVRDTGSAVLSRRIDHE